MNAEENRRVVDKTSMGILAKLTAPEMRVIRMLYMDGPTRSLQEVANHLGISHTRVGQIRSIAMKRIHHWEELNETFAEPSLTVKDVDLDKVKRFFERKNAGSVTSIAQQMKDVKSEGEETAKKKVVVPRTLNFAGLYHTDHGGLVDCFRVNLRGLRELMPEVNLTNFDSAKTPPIRRTLEARFSAYKSLKGVVDIYNGRGYREAHWAFKKNKETGEKIKVWIEEQPKIDPTIDHIPSKKILAQVIAAVPFA